MSDNSNNTVAVNITSGGVSGYTWGFNGTTSLAPVTDRLNNFSIAFQLDASSEWSFTSITFTDANKSVTCTPDNTLESFGLAALALGTFTSTLYYLLQGYVLKLETTLSNNNKTMMLSINMTSQGEQSAQPEPEYTLGVLLGAKRGAEANPDFTQSPDPQIVLKPRPTNFK